MASINLAGRIPLAKRTISGRMVFAAVSFFVLLVLAVIYGFHHRIAKKEAQKEANREAMVASDAAQSNRRTLEQPSEVPTTVPSSDQQAAGQQVRPNWVPNAFHVTPTQGSPQPAGQVSQTPVYYGAPPPPVAQPDSAAELQKQTMARQLSRQIAALEAPTGIHYQSSTSPVATTPDPNPLQEAMAQYRALQNPVPSASASAPGASDLFAGSGYKTENDQAGKRAFQEGDEKPEDDYLSATRVPPLSRWVVQRGIVIPATLSHSLVSDLPGDLIAETVRDVYDSPTQRYVMIPAGSRLVGEYNSSVTYGQSRVQVAWTAVYFPDGSHVDLDRMGSHAADGSSGLKDQVDNHYKRLIGGVVLSSLFAAGIQVSQNRSQTALQYPSTGQVVGAAVGQQAGELGEQITNRNLNIQPSIKIRAGEIFSVSVKKDIVFPGPYEPLPVK